MNAGIIMAAGVFDLALAIFHILFWRLYRWPDSLRASGRLNAAVTQTLNIMLTYVFVVLGLSLLWLGAQTPAILLLSAAGFGVIRIYLQFTLFSVRGLASGIFTGLMALGTLLHLIPPAIPG